MNVLMTKLSYTRMAPPMALLAGLLIQVMDCFAAPPQVTTGNKALLADYSLEQLMNVSVEVTSASRKPQKLEDAAAAIHVISREDIRRSGMSSLPELLRQVPGMQVAQIDGSTWAISSRGFNAKNSDNLLVMLDGRVLQTPTFTGVYWDMQDVMLEDVERIEVVRGSGGALWGANAVTGVINIITKSAQSSQGGLVSVGGGSHERQGSFRYGGTLGEIGHYRVYGRSSQQDDFKWASGADAYDRHNLRSAGFRADLGLSGGSSLTLQGDTYDGGSNHTGSATTLVPPASTPVGYTIDLKGGNVLARWKQALTVTSEWALQFYYDFYERRYFNLGERRDTYDLDFQHRFLAGDAHDIVWGLGYRRSSDKMDNSFVVSFTPASRTESVLSAFFQDEIALHKDSVHLIAGSKFEHNDYTGFEVQPNLRLRWKIDDRHMTWAAVSRAVHTPSRTDANGQVVASVVPGPGGIPLAIQLQGNPAIRSEHVAGYEAGYRIRPSERVQMDVAVFYNEHQNLATIEPGTSYLVAGTPAYRVSPQIFFNKAKARTRGLEWSGNWRPTDAWQFKAAYSWLKMNIRRDADSRDASIEAEVGRSSQNQLQLQVFHSPTARIDLSAALYYVDKLPSLSVPAYTRLDARVGWRVQRDLELSLTARNLLDSGHAEFVNPSGPRNSEIPRSLFAAATWRF